MRKDTFWTHVIFLVLSAWSVVVARAIAQWLSIYLSSSPLQDMIHHDASAVATATTVAQCQFFRFLFRDLLFFDIHITAIVLKPYHSFFCMHPLLSIMANREKNQTSFGHPPRFASSSWTNQWLSSWMTTKKNKLLQGEDGRRLRDCFSIPSTVLVKAWTIWLSSQTSWKEQSRTLG